MQNKIQIENSKIKNSQINTKEDANLINALNINQNILNNNKNEKLYEKNTQNSTSITSKLIFLNNF